MLWVLAVKRVVAEHGIPVGQALDVNHAEVVHLKRSHAAQPLLPEQPNSVRQRRVRQMPRQRIHQDDKHIGPDSIGISHRRD
jgi:hypothetical protein